MIEVDISGYGKLRLEHLVLDYNGTMACDGKVIQGVAEALDILASDLSIHVLTADTFGNVRSALTGLPCRLSVLPPGSQEKGKLEYVRELGAKKTVCVGNGRNDRLMLKEAVLGIAVLQEEGCALESLMAGDVVCRHILDALDLLRFPGRLTATLRS
jgi:soluble P-type ATPase